MIDDEFPKRTPRLRDQAAAELFDILNDFVQDFEAAYGHQIHRHYQHLDSIGQRDHPPSERPTPEEDPPF